MVCRLMIITFPSPAKLMVYIELIYVGAYVLGKLLVKDQNQGYCMAKITGEVKDNHTWKC